MDYVVGNTQHTKMSSITAIAQAIIRKIYTVEQDKLMLGIKWKEKRARDRKENKNSERKRSFNDEGSRERYKDEIMWM